MRINPNGTSEPLDQQAGGEEHHSALYARDGVDVHRALYLKDDFAITRC